MRAGNKPIHVDEKETNLEIKRYSINRERISNAGIIGLQVAFGNDVLVKLPSKTSTLTYANLQILSTTIGDTEISQLTQQDNNDLNKRSRESLVMNTVSSTFQSIVNSRCAKKKKATKSIKLNIFVEIEPFNATGFKLFGKGVIDIITSRPCYGTNKRDSTVLMRKFDSEILQLIYSIAENPGNVSVNGFQIIEQIKNYSTIQTPEELYQNPLPDIINEDMSFADSSVQSEFSEREESLRHSFTLMSYQNQFERDCLQHLEGFVTTLRTHATCLEHFAITQPPGLNKKVDVDSIVNSVEFLANEFEVLQQRFIELENNNTQIINKILNAEQDIRNKDTFLDISSYLHFQLPIHLLDTLYSFAHLFSIGDLHFTTNSSLKQQQERCQNDKFNYSVNNINPVYEDIYHNSSLSEILQSEHRKSTQLPLQLEKSLLYLFNHCCSTPSLFADNEIHHQRAIELHKRFSMIDFESLPPLTVAESIKLFLVNLKQKIIGKEQTDYLMKEWKKLTELGVSSHSKLIREALQSLQTENISLLKSILKLCNKVESISDLNGMTFPKLSQSLYKCFFTYDIPSKNIKDSKTLSNRLESTSFNGIDIPRTLEEILLFMLTNFKHLFPEETNELVVLRSSSMRQRLMNSIKEGVIEKDVITSLIDVPLKGLDKNQHLNRLHSFGVIPKEDPSKRILPKDLLQEIRQNILNKPK